MSTTTIDMERVIAFAQQVGGMLAGGVTAAMMVVGDRLGLYAALGFRVAATRPGYYAKPTEDALILWREGLDASP